MAAFFAFLQLVMAVIILYNVYFNISNLLDVFELKNKHKHSLSLNIMLNIIGIGVALCSVYGAFFTVRLMR